MTTQMRNPKANQQLSFLNQDLKGRLFRDQDLSGTDFRYAEMQGTIFDNCILDKSDFEGAELGDVKFVNKCKLIEAQFINADMYNVEIDNTCEISKINLTKACIIGLILPNKIGSIVDNTECVAQELGIDPIPRYI